ncbi:MAG: dual specificity protein phosphatase family protein [Desulfobacterales bacterium]|nr:dual specificity protein phosphatase family protein [Desulfobacterales bacterium]
MKKLSSYHPLKYGVYLSIIGIVIISCSYLFWKNNLIGYWTGFSAIFVSISYFANSTILFGKNQNGKLALHSILILPYLIIIRLIWHIQKLISNESKMDKVTDNLYAGRRILNFEVPNFITQVIDLTCEFNEPSKIAKEKKYYSLSILDGGTPQISHLRNILSNINLSNEKTLIHCAKGHGRTSMIIVLFLLKNGICNNIEEAINFLISKRPKAKMNKHQKQFVEKFYNNL